VITAGRKQ